MNAANKDLAMDALGNPIRREILSMLAERPRSVAELSAPLPISRPAVSKHLKLLTKAQLVVHEGQGTRNLYRLERDGFDAARGWIDAFWSDALTRFKLLAENTDPEA